MHSTDVPSSSFADDDSAVDVEIIETASATAPAPISRPESGRLHHTLLLIGSMIVLFLSLTMSLRDERLVTLPLFSQPLPHACFFYRTTGLDCPGCGLTRSFISFGHGDLAASWRFNPAGPIMFLIMVAQIPYRACQLWRIQRGKPELYLVSFYWIAWLVTATLLGQWLIRLVWHGA